MSDTDYGEMVRIRAGQKDLNASQVHPLDAHLGHMAFGVVGEAGEVFKLIEKKVFEGEHLDLNPLIKELGSLEFYLENLRAALGVSREETISADIRRRRCENQAITNRLRWVNKGSDPAKANAN